MLKSIISIALLFLSIQSKAVEDLTTAKYSFAYEVFLGEKLPYFGGVDVDINEIYFLTIKDGESSTTLQLRVTSFGDSNYWEIDDSGSTISGTLLPSGTIQSLDLGKKRTIKISIKNLEKKLY